MQVRPIGVRETRTIRPKRTMSRSRDGASAWLVTWEHCGDHARPKERVAAVLSPKLGAERVRELVEFLYLNATSSVEERIGFARDKGSNPYHAQFGAVHGVPWTGQIQCGHNPWLFARLVDHLRAYRNEDGSEAVEWDERPVPSQVLELAASLVTAKDR